MFARASILSFVVFALLAGPCEPPGQLAFVSQAAACERPNVVLILADDLGYHDCSLYAASDWFPTGALNRIASGGCVFERAYAYPVCSATRGSLLSGRSSARTHVTGANGHRPEDWTEALVASDGPAWSPAAIVRSASRLKAGYITLAETFQANGYATGQFGKWHLGPGAWGPGNQGFDVHLPDTFDRAGPPAGGYVEWTTPTLSPDPPLEHVEDRLSREVQAFIAEHADEPFFVYWSTYSVHGPFEAKAPLLAQYQARSDANGRSPTYGAMVAALNAAIAAVLNQLEALDLDDETIVIFASDNGGNASSVAPGETVPVTSNAPLRSGKGTLWEGGLRVPLVIRVPGLTSGTRCAEPVRIEDLYPTLCELCDLSPPAGLDGVSLVPALQGEALLREHVFAFFPHASPSVTDFTHAGATVHDAQGFKLLREFYAAGDGTHRDRLYSLPGDPGETLDLSTLCPDKRAELSAALDAWLDQTQAPLPLPNPDFDPLGPTD